MRYHRDGLPDRVPIGTALRSAGLHSRRSYGFDDASLTVDGLPRGGPQAKRALQRMRRRRTLKRFGVGVASALMVLVVLESVYAGRGFPHRVLGCLVASWHSIDFYVKSGLEHVSLDVLLRGNSMEVLQLAVPLGSFPTDKHAGHNYTTTYEHILAPYRARSIATQKKKSQRERSSSGRSGREDDLLDDVDDDDEDDAIVATEQPEVRLLEVGVGKGGSMKLWREYFGSHASIVGIDTRDRIPQFKRDARMKTLVLDARDGASVASALSTLAFDIIIDDASSFRGAKLAADVNETLHNLRPFLKPRGVYIIEDWDRRWSPLKVLSVRRGDLMHQHADTSQFACLLTIAPNMSLTHAYAPAGGWSALGRVLHEVVQMKNWQRARLAVLQEQSKLDPRAFAAAKEEARLEAERVAASPKIPLPPPLVLKAKYRGVHWDKRFNFGWKAQIKVGGKKRFLGVFATQMEAAKAFDKALRLYFPKRKKLLNFKNAPTPHPTALGCPACAEPTFCCKSSDHMGGAECCAHSMECIEGKCTVPQWEDEADDGEHGWIDVPGGAEGWELVRSKGGGDDAGGRRPPPAAAAPAVSKVGLGGVGGMGGGV